MSDTTIKIIRIIIQVLKFAASQFLLLLIEDEKVKRDKLK